MQRKSTEYAMQLLKDLFDLALFPIIAEVEQKMLLPYANVVEYRSQVKNLQRGATIFMQNLKKTVNFEEVVRKSMSIGQSYFVLIHESLYHWARFVSNDKHKFRMVYEKLAKYCEFPKEFKYFKPGCVESYHKRLKQEQQSIEYQIEELVQDWEQNLEKMRKTNPQRNEKEVMKMINNISIDCEEFALNYLDRMKEINESGYYEREKLKKDMERLKKEMKQFFDLERAARQAKKYNKIFDKYFRSGLADASELPASASRISEPPQIIVSQDVQQIPGHLQSQMPASHIEEVQDQEDHNLKKSMVSSKQRKSSADFVDQPTGPHLHPPNKGSLLDSHSVYAHKAKRVPKSPKSTNNIPTYRSVVFAGKESFSMAQCDTSALDAAKEIGAVQTKVVKNLLQIPKSSQKDTASPARSSEEKSIPMLRSAREIHSFEQPDQHKNEMLQTVPIHANAVEPKSNMLVAKGGENRMLHSVTNVLSQPIHRTESVTQNILDTLESGNSPQPIKPVKQIEKKPASNSKKMEADFMKETDFMKEEEVVWNRIKLPLASQSAKDQNITQRIELINKIGSSSFHRKSLGTQRTVDVCLDNTALLDTSLKKQQPTVTKRNLKFSRLRAIKLQHTIEKESIGIQAATTTKQPAAVKPSCDYHNLYDISLYSKISSSSINQPTTDTVSCQTHKQFASTELTSAGYSVGLSATSKRRRNSISSNGERSSSLRRFSFGNNQNAFPEESMLGLLHSRKTML